MRWYVMLIAALLALRVGAQDLKADGDVFHFEADFRAGLHSDGYEFGLGVAYLPLQYVGIKASIGFSGEIEALEDWGHDEWETGHSYALRFKFNPALVLRSPRIVNWKSQDAGLYLFAEPGIVLSPGAHGSVRAKTFCWDLKCGVNLQFDRFIFSAGYGLSDFCLYSGDPDSHWGAPDGGHPRTHLGFAGISYKF